MYRFKTCFRWFIVLAALGGLLICGCGGNGNGDDAEVVYLSVFNAYPGSTSLDLYGPSGTIVTGLGFGERSDEPIRVDRNLGVDLTLILDGAAQDFEIEPDLYSLYPQETATFMVTRRDDGEAQFKLFRHQQSISPSCRLVPDNSLALTTDPIGIYSFVLGWDFEGMIEVSGHNQQAEQDFLDDGNIVVAQNVQDRRDRLFDGIPDHPFFALVPITDDDGSPAAAMEFVWLGPEDRVDLPRVDFADGSLFTYPNSSQYLTCIAEEVAGQEPDPGEPFVIGPESTCGSQNTYELRLYEPALLDPSGFVHYYPETVGNSLADENACSMNFGIYSDFDNIFEGDHGYDGYNENTRLYVEAEFDVSDHFFFSLYGRPAQNPQIEQWTASQIDDNMPGFVDMDDYPSAD